MAQYFFGGLALAVVLFFYIRTELKIRKRLARNKEALEQSRKDLKDAWDKLTPEDISEGLKTIFKYVAPERYQKTQMFHEGIPESVQGEVALIRTKTEAEVRLKEVEVKLALAHDRGDADEFLRFTKEKFLLDQHLKKLEQIH